MLYWKAGGRIFISAALNDSGNYYIRSSWEEDADLLHFHCGTMGAGHGHSDKLHVDLILAGEDVLTDSGRYTYVVDRGRFEFKNPDAHNTVIVDGEFFTQCKDAWECSKLTQPVKQLFKEKDGYAFIQGGNLGYMHKGVFVNRKIVSLGDGLYVIADELYGAGDHEMEQYWNFSERGRAAYENGRAVFTGERVKAELLFVSPGCQAALGEGKISRHYNRYETRARLGVKRAGKGFQSMITVIGGGKKGGGTQDTGISDSRKVSSEGHHLPGIHGRSGKGGNGKAGICGDPLPPGGKFTHRSYGSRRLYGIWKCDCFLIKGKAVQAERCFAIDKV